MNIQMVDLKNQYKKIKNLVDDAVISCIESTEYINGKKVTEFANNLARYVDAKFVIPCANGTDALQIAIMALDLEPGDEIIIPSFTYVATAEVIALLKLTPVMVDVDPESFNITAELIEPAISDKTKAIVPVHLFGQSCDMGPIIELAKKHDLYIIEDNAQALGAHYNLGGKNRKTGTLGHIGCTSFFPSKNLGCFGDGGAIFTDDENLAKKLKMIANHGQSVKYKHDIVGCNSRLDTIQAAILEIKLNYLDDYIKARQNAADMYDAKLCGIDGIKLPKRSSNALHAFNQYTIQVNDGKRDELKKHLLDNSIPSMIYYPLPLNRQPAFMNIARIAGTLDVSESLCSSVLSLPIHTEITEEEIDHITNSIKRFYE